MSFYQDAESTARMRGAYEWTRLQEGHRSFSEFMDTTLMAEVRRLEEVHNEGGPFPSVEARGIPQGRQLGQ